MGWRIKHRESSKQEWVTEPDVFETKAEAEALRDLGLAIFGGQAEVVCEECSEPVTAKFTRVQHAK